MEEGRQVPVTRSYTPVSSEDDVGYFDLLVKCYHVSGESDWLVWTGAAAILYIIISFELYVSARVCVPAFVYVVCARVCVCFYRMVRCLSTSRTWRWGNSSKSRDPWVGCSTTAWADCLSKERTR